MKSYYPLAVGNTWTYKTQDGQSFTNTVTELNGDVFTMMNSMMPRPQSVRRDGDTFLADNFEPGNFQLFLKENPEPGETWDVIFRANNINNILTLTVKETGISKEVEGKTFDDVMLMEGDMKINVNGNIMSANYVVQYFYARGVGLVLTSSSFGDSVGLVSYELK